MLSTDLDGDSLEFRTAFGLVFKGIWILVFGCSGLWILPGVYSGMVSLGSRLWFFRIKKEEVD